MDRDLIHFLNLQGFILPSVYDKVLNPVSNLSDLEKAGELVQFIKNRVKQDPDSYQTLLDRLKKVGNFYRPIVNDLEAEYKRQVQWRG